MVAVPTMGSIHPLLTHRLLLWAKKYPNVTFYFTFRIAPVDRARNNIVKQFLTQTVDGKHFTHLLFIDSDTIPPVDALPRLLAHDLPFVTALTPILKYDKGNEGWTAYDNCFTHTEKDETGKVVKTHVAKRNSGLVEIYRSGAACMLLKRELFEKLEEPYFQFVPNDDNTEHVLSEDIHFCDMIRAAGIRPYADTDVYCEHEKTVMI